MTGPKEGLSLQGNPAALGETLPGSAAGGKGWELTEHEEVGVGELSPHPSCFMAWGEDPEQDGDGEPAWKMGAEVPPAQILCMKHKG